MHARKMSVSALSATPVKGLRIAARESLRLERDRIAGDRAFYLVDERARMLNGKRCAGLQALHADYDDGERLLTIVFPGGRSVSAVVALGVTLRTRFFSQERRARLVEGPFAGALSEHLGMPVRLVAPVRGNAADRGAAGAVSVISNASLARLAREARRNAIDPRRFRMSVQLEGPAAHEEDLWVGRSISLGSAHIALEGHVGRCVVTTRDPEGERVDLPTLDLLRAYRAHAATSEPLAFGVYGCVLEPGVVRVGDEVSLVDTAADQAFESTRSGRMRVTRHAG